MTLLQPITLGPRTARNRIVNAPHGTGLARGTYSPDLLAYLAARAEGGAGIVISQATFVTPDYGDLKVLPDGGMRPAFTALAEAVHQHGAMVFVQLQHPGSQAVFTGSGVPVLQGPSAVPLRFFGGAPAVPRVMSEADIALAVKGFADGARQAAEAGIDGVELHFAHGNLVEQFLSPHTNRRTDAWGGSDANRRRLAREIVGAVREAVGERIVVGVRVTGGVPGDPSASAESLEIVGPLLELGGFDYVSVSAGHYSSAQGAADNLPDASYPPGVWSEFGRAVKRLTDRPVLLSGRITSARLGQQLIDDGAADLIGMTRALIADPELPRKFAAGREPETRPCVGIQDGCWGRLARGLPLSCSFNPVAGNENRVPEPVGAEEKHIVVVGGGPAGLEAARVASGNGHRVTLLERRPDLGGQLRLASSVPHRGELRDVLDWMEQQGRANGVKFRTGVEATAGEILDLEPDLVLLATGSHTSPELEGEVPAHRVLAGAAIGPRVLLYDERGGRVGLSVAEAIVAAGHRLTFVTPLTYPGMGVDETVRTPSCRRLAKAGVRFFPATGLVGLQQGWIQLRDEYGGGDFTLRADTFVASRPPVAVDGLRDDLAALAPALQVRLIGDARAPRGVTEATAEGHEAGRALGRVERSGLAGPTSAARPTGAAGLTGAPGPTSAAGLTGVAG